MSTGFAGRGGLSASRHSPPEARPWDGGGPQTMAGVWANEWPWCSQSPPALSPGSC